MKGLIISLATLVCYGLSTVVAAHVWRPKRHLKLFVYTIPVGVVVYLLAYWLTPSDLYFLPGNWICSNRWVDLIYGIAVFLIGCHGFACAAFVTCNGFSVSLLVAIHEARRQSVSTQNLVARFRTADGTDSIYNWRVPHLQERNYIQINPGNGQCMLTAKGLLVARLARFLKRLMNLGKGG